MADDKSNETVLKDARELFAESEEQTSFSRQAARDDIDFARLGNQWPDDIRTTRQKENRPCLTINRLPAFIRQVVNDARQNKPSITVHPVDNGADVETAEVIGGLVRSIERRSHADIAYDTAIDHACSGGFGFFQIGIDYCHPDSFDLECRIERVANPLMVHWDPSSTAFDASDWGFAFVSDFYSEDEFDVAFPKANRVSFEGDDKDLAGNWLDGDKIRVASFWQRVEKTRRVLLLSNGLTVRGDEFDKDIAAALGLEVLKERDATFYEVKRHLISGVEVLQSEPWPGSTIPICPVWGDEVMLEGRRHFRSLIRDAKDPQAMFNFWRSATTELVALAPRNPWMIEEGAIPEGAAHKWETANSRSWPYLEYAAGKNPPRREPFAGVPGGAMQEALSAADDMKAIIGIYDSALGARSNETSGRAIMARQREADVSNFHFVDNLSRAIRYAGEVLVEIIPSVYKDQQAVRILGEDMAEKVARLGSQNADYGSPASYMEGEDRLYDLSVGKYDVDVKTGPSYTSQREETREMLIEIMRQVPGAAQFIGDIAVEHMDFQGADKVAERLKMLLPPMIQQAEGLPVMQPQGMPGAVPGQTAGEPFPQGSGYPV